MAQKMFELVSIFEKANLSGRLDPQTEQQQQQLFHTHVVPTEPEESEF